MATYLDYARRDGDQPDRWPNLREAATKPWMGQTALIGRRPWLVVGFDGEMYELENEFGARMRSNKFEVLEYDSNNNRLVAASRIEDSPLGLGYKLADCGCDIAGIDFDRDSLEWSVLNENGEVVDVEKQITSLEDADWKVAETLKQAEMPAYDPILDTKEHEYFCPECGAPEVEFSDDVAYCNQCGWHGSPQDVDTDKDIAYDRQENYDDDFAARHRDYGYDGDPNDMDNARLRSHVDQDWQFESDMQKGSPYPENSDKNAPDHSPPGQKLPKQVNSIYNACMREDNGKGSTKEEKEASCMKIAWAQHKKNKKSDIEAKSTRVARIVMRDGKHCVVSEDGSKNLGCSDSLEGAKKRLREVEYFKHQGALALADLQIEADQEGVSERKDENHDPLKCPQCGSHTVDLMNSDEKKFRCLSCGNEFKHEEITLNPSAPKPKKGATLELVDSDGRPVTGGQYYNLHGDKYKIPDVIKVLEIRDGHIIATVDSNPNPLQITADDIQKEGYSFEPLPIYSNIEKHDLREAVSWSDNPDEPVWSPGMRNRVEETPLSDIEHDNIRQDALTQGVLDTGGQEFTLPTPSGGTLWVRTDPDGRVSGWSVPGWDGGPGKYSDRDLDRVQSMVDAATVEAVKRDPSLSKVARRAFTPAEQKKLIEERGNARNKDKLRLDDSHYIESSNDEDDINFLF